MRFNLENPWFEWIIKTDVGKQMTDAKIDTGSSLTLVGIKITELLGLKQDFILCQPCVSFKGVSGIIEGYAFKNNEVW